MIGRGAGGSWVFSRGHLAERGTTLDEREYERRAAAAFERVLNLFGDVDPDEADLDQAGDVITVDLGPRGKLILNTQRPARQLWLAGGTTAWHFDYDPEADRWVDARHGGAELLGTLRQLMADAGVTLPNP